MRNKRRLRHPVIRWKTALQVFPERRRR